jgi:hypothetical protein
MPGERGHMIMVNHYRDPADPRNQGIPGGLPGQYTAVITLSRPSLPLAPEYSHSFERGLTGDSHIAITRPAFSPPADPGATEIRGRGVGVDGTPHEWAGFPNKRGFLAKIHIKAFDAQNLSDAEYRAYRIVAPSLSNWSAHLDVPVHVAQIDVVELRTGNTQASLRNPWLEVPWAVAGHVALEPEYRSAASLYREALESSSPVYRFLCFFKIIESILALRVRREREAKHKGLPFSRPPEVVPANREDIVPWLNGIYSVRPPTWDPLMIDEVFHPEARGKTFEELTRKGEGRKPGGPLRQLRVDIAHGLWTEGGGTLLLTMSADELLNHVRVNAWLPLTRCIVRYMLKHEWPDQFLRHLRDDGTLVPESELKKDGDKTA